jgi:DNA-binding NarL/FixJ family response regulator
MTDTVSVLVVDDHPIVLDGVRHLVDSTSWISLSGYARTGREAVTLAEQTQPDVVLLDLRLPDMLGPEVIHGIHRGAPAARVVLFTAYPDHAAVEPALAAGAHAVVLKDVDRADLVDIIRRVAAGEPFGSGPGAIASAGEHNQQLTDKLRRFALTRREYDILRRISMGETNPEIADALGLTRNTVKTYVQSALNKLGARNRIEALNRLHELGLL